MSDRPNIIVLISHDTGQHISPYGIDTVDTPNFERLAAQSVRFENSFCTAPGCSPSRASLFTGRYPHSNGVMGLCHAEFHWRLNDDERHASHILRDAGYATWLVNTYHETRDAKTLGFEHLDLDGRSIMTVPSRIEPLLADRDPSRPFYLQIGTPETHRPFVQWDTTPDDSKGVHVPPYLNDGPGTRGEFAELQGSVRTLDRGLGEIMDVLERQGVADNTIFVVTTDHGIAMPRAKCTLYDAGIEVLLFMRWPRGGWGEGQVCGDMVSNVDVLPTLLEATGVEIPDRIQGRSFLGHLEGSPGTPRHEIFAEKNYHGNYDPMRCVRSEEYKYIVSLERTCRTEFAEFELAPSRVELGRRYGPRRPQEELYRIAEDRHEQTNLAEDAAHAGALVEMRGILADWMRRTKDPLLQGPISSPTYSETLDILMPERTAR